MNSPGFPWWLVVLILGWVPALVLHELGHAVAGRLAGLTVAACGVGYRRAVGVRVAGCRWFVGLGDGGLTVFLPRRWVPSRGRWAVGVAGGPLANLLVATGSVAAWRAGAGGGWAAFAGVNLQFGLANLVPGQRLVGGAAQPSDGLLLWLYLRNAVPAVRAVARARHWEKLHAAVGEPRGYALHLDQAAVEWDALRASEAAARCRATAAAVRFPDTGPLERAAQAVAAGQLDTAMRLLPGDAAFRAYARSVLAGGPADDPWERCRRMREQAASADPVRAAELYRLAVAAAFEPASQIGDHPDDWAAFVEATDRLLLDLRRAVLAAGGDPRQATRELLAPHYTRGRLAIVPPPAQQNPAADRRRWRIGVGLAAGQLLLGLGLVGVVAGVAARPMPGPVRLAGLVGFAAVLWAVAPLVAAGLFALMPGSRPGHGEAGRLVLWLAVGAVVGAAVQVAVTARLAFAG